MSDDLITVDNRLTLSEAGRAVGVSPNTVFRWIREGRSNVLLAHGRLGWRMFTSKPALDRFMREVAEAETRENTTTAAA